MRKHYRRERLSSICLALLGIPFLVALESYPSLQVAPDTASSKVTDAILDAVEIISVDAVDAGFDILSEQIADDRAVVSVYYAGPASGYVVCENASWAKPGGGITNVDLARSSSFLTLDESSGRTLEAKRSVRLDALTKVIIQASEQGVRIDPKSHYILSMVTNSFDQDSAVGSHSERLEFDTGSIAELSSGQHCKSTGDLEVEVIGGAG